MAPSQEDIFKEYYKKLSVNYKPWREHSVDDLRAVCEADIASQMVDADVAAVRVSVFPSKLSSSGVLVLHKPFISVSISSSSNVMLQGSTYGKQPALCRSLRPKFRARRARCRCDCLPHPGTAPSPSCFIFMGAAGWSATRTMRPASHL